MESEISILKKSELAELRLRRLFEQYGYQKYRMNQFEEYAFYIENKNFLGSDSFITFNDKDGKLMALKPDVTLSMEKNTAALILLSAFATWEFKVCTNSCGSLILQRT